MKSLNDDYTSSHGGSHETFADLMFCALVVMVLFVMALAIEVSQRVRAELTPTEPVEVVEEAQLTSLTPEEVAELSEKLQNQEQQINRLKNRLQARAEEIESQSTQVANQMAALAGEQRFTGAREPAALTIAYNYKTDRFFFVPSRDVNHADRRTSGESFDDYLARKRMELMAISASTQGQRGFTLQEMKSLYTAFSQYTEVIPEGNSYRLTNSDVGIYYHTQLCGYLSGDSRVLPDDEQEIMLQLAMIYREEGSAADGMYPKVALRIDTDKKAIHINGVKLSTRTRVRFCFRWTDVVRCWIWRDCKAARQSGFGNKS